MGIKTLWLGNLLDREWNMSSGSVTISIGSRSVAITGDAVLPLDLYTCGFVCTPFSSNGLRQVCSVWWGGTRSGLVPGLLGSQSSAELCYCGPLYYVASISSTHQRRQAWAGEASRTSWGAIKTIACARPRCYVLENVVPITKNLNSEVVDSALSKLSGYVVVKLKARAKSGRKPMHSTSKLTHADTHTHTLNKSAHHNSLIRANDRRIG